MLIDHRRLDAAARRLAIAEFHRRQKSGFIKPVDSLTATTLVELAFKPRAAVKLVRRLALRRHIIWDPETREIFRGHL